MFQPPGSRLSPAEYALRLDEAKARAKELRDEAIRELGSSLFAAFAALGRRLVGAARAGRAAPLPAVPAADPAR